MQEPYIQTWWVLQTMSPSPFITNKYPRPRAYEAVRKLFSEPQHLSKKADEDPHAGITEIDYEEQTSGYQAAYSRLASAEAQEADPVAYVSNPQQFFQEQLDNLQKQYGNQVQALMSQV